MHQNPPLNQNISWDVVKPGPGRRCLIKTRVTNCKLALSHTTRVPVLSSLFTRGAWRDICWLNNFLQASTSSEDVSLLEGCLRKKVYLHRHHAVQFTSSTITHCHVSLFSKKSAICSSGPKMCQKCVWEDNRSLLDASNTGFHWELLTELKWTRHSIVLTSYSTETMVEWLWILTGASLGL